MKQRLCGDQGIWEERGPSKSLVDLNPQDETKGVCFLSRPNRWVVRDMGTWSLRRNIECQEYNLFSKLKVQ